MQAQAFVIGDIHGMHTQFERLLAHWQSETQQLILVGDLMDRGPNSLAVIKRVRQLQQEAGAICLCGNHEAMLLEMLTQPEERYFERYVRNGGWTTLSELLNTPVETLQQWAIPEIVTRVKTQHDWLVSWLESLPLYVEFGNFVVVHAGVDLTLENWQQSSRRDFVWIREPFHELPNTTGRQFIFGHTPTNSLHGKIGHYDIWQDANKIGIDGGAVYGGVLHGIVIDHHHLLTNYHVK
ncbi:MAG: metallophosphoesterase family protein [Aerococcaceae bacterium]|nr:metallophosphoesterase family protein [Aerococcaceae bacterium]